VFTPICLLVCSLSVFFLSINTITKKTTDQIFTKHYGMSGHNPQTNRLDFE